MFKTLRLISGHQKAVVGMKTVVDKNGIIRKEKVDYVRIVNSIEEVAMQKFQSRVGEDDDAALKELWIKLNEEEREIYLTVARNEVKCEFAPLNERKDTHFLKYVEEMEVANKFYNDERLQAGWRLRRKQEIGKVRRFLQLHSRMVRDGEETHVSFKGLLEA